MGNETTIWKSREKKTNSSKVLMARVSFLYVGGLFVAAAGNAAANNDNTDFYPSNFNLPCVLSVASTTSTDNLSSFSNFGQ